MSEEKFIEKLEHNIAQYIFMASAALVGVSLTAINLIHLHPEFRMRETLVDDLLTFDAFAFLLSGVSAYISLRSRKSSVRHIVEKFADYLFLTALGVMTVVCGLVTYEVL